MMRVWFNSSVGGVLKRNPLPFNAATGGTLCGASDVVAQVIEKREQHQESDQDQQRRRVNLAREVLAQDDQRPPLNDELTLMRR